MDLDVGFSLLIVSLMTDQSDPGNSYGVKGGQLLYFDSQSEENKKKKLH